MVHVCFEIWYNVITFVVLFTAAADEHAVSSRGQKLKSSSHSAIAKGDFVQYYLEFRIFMSKAFSFFIGTSSISGCCFKPVCFLSWYNVITFWL